jgi:hypothetical protein
MKKLILAVFCIMFATSAMAGQVKKLKKPIKPVAPKVIEKPNYDGPTKAFLDKYIEGKIRGLPKTPEDEKFYADYLTKDLIADLKKAADYEKAQIAKTPVGSKPNILEGDIFTDLYEGATKYLMASAYRMGANYLIVEVSFTNDIDNDKIEPFTWVDRIVLKKQDTKWLVDDVMFNRGNTLKMNLESYISGK